MKWNEESIRDYMLRFLVSHSDEITDLAYTYVVDIPIEISKRLKSTLGQYEYMRGSQKPVKFKFSYDYLCNHSDEEIKNTIEHELAHLMANTYYKKSCGHGYLWKGICRKYGINDERCASFDKSQEGCRYEIRSTVNNLVIYRHRVNQYVKDNINRYSTKYSPVGTLYVIDTTTGEVFR